MDSKLSDEIEEQFLQLHLRKADLWYVEKRAARARNDLLMEMELADPWTDLSTLRFFVRGWERLAEKLRG